MQLHNILRRLRILPTSPPAVEFFGGVYSPAGNAELLVALTYGATIAIDASAGNQFVVTVTDGNAFVTSNPIQPPAGTFAQVIVIVYRNASGGALGAGTFDTLYKVAANVPAIANGSSRAICFRWNGTNWVEMWRGATDVPN